MNNTDKKKVLLVTLAIGDKYLHDFQTIFMPSHKLYCSRHGYDYKVISNYIGDIHYPAVISLEKQLVCSQSWSADYDFIIFIDADILINPTAPPIHMECIQTDKIGVIDEMQQPTREDRHALQVSHGWEKTVKEYYSMAQLDLDTDIIYNSGVIILQPKIHGEFCKNIYHKYKNTQLYHPRYFHYEQAVINYEYQKADLCLKLNSKWNAVWYLYKSTTYKETLNDFINSNYFIHMAGHCDYNLAKEWTDKIFG